MSCPHAFYCIATFSFVVDDGYNGNTGAIVCQLWLMYSCHRIQAIVVNQTGDNTGLLLGGFFTTVNILNDNLNILRELLLVKTLISMIMMYLVLFNLYAKVLEELHVGTISLRTLPLNTSCHFYISVCLQIKQTGYMLISQL